MSRGSIDVNFTENRELNIILLYEGLNRLFFGWFLVELMAWETKDLQTFRTIFFVQKSQLLIVLFGLASSRCYINY